MGTEETERVLQGDRRVVTTCGSGMTAGVLWLGLNLLGVRGVALYDEVRPFFPPSCERCCGVIELSPELDRVCGETPEQNRKRRITL